MPFLALTTTPSMAPSSAEETLPVRAGGDLVCAAAGAAKPARAKAAVIRTRIRERMSLSKLIGRADAVRLDRRHRGVDAGLCGYGAASRRLSFDCNVGRV